MVKLPTITYDKVASSALSIVGGPYIPNALIAILPLSHKRYETWVFGIVLNRLQAVGFLRPAKSLLLLSRVWVRRLRYVSERLIMTVRDEAPTSSSSANRTGLQRMAFDFHSPSFKVETWFSYLTPDTARISSGPCARFYSHSEDSHIILLVSSENIPGLTVRCMLKTEAGPHTTNVQLREAQFITELSGLVPSEFSKNRVRELQTNLRPCNNTNFTVMPLGPVIRIALRPLAVEQSTASTDFVVAARYRVGMVYEEITDSPCEV
jgi:hypothetical protein